jgi:tetratricopeptide (TPR) repeat protein/CheY-like chemotaxis protein
MSFLETIPRVNSRGLPEQDSAWTKSLSETLPLKGTTVLMLDRSVPSTKQLKDELSLLGATQLDLVTNPNDFFRLVGERNYDFIFCDYSIDDRRTGAVILEELRHRYGYDLSASVIAVSGDRSSHALCNLMEFEPEVFLIRPFSAEELSRRIIRVHARRLVSQPINRARRQGKLEAAIQLCDEALQDFPQYEKELLRTKVDLLLRAEASDEADRILKGQSGTNSPCWVDLYLANLCVKKGELPEAEIWLRKAISRAPHYIGAYSQLADLLITMRREEEALSVLEGLSNTTHASAKRLRQMVDLSDMLGYTEQKRNYLTRLIDKTHGTLLLNTTDYYRLAQTYMEQMRNEEALKVLTRMRSVVDASESELAEAMMLVYGMMVNKDEQRARTAFEEVAKRQVSKGIRLSSGGQALMMLLCARFGLLKRAESMYTQLMKNSDSASFRAWLKRQMVENSHQKNLMNNS